MREMLDSALKASSPELQGQLNYIIAQLGSTDDQWPGEFASDDEGMEEEENDVYSILYPPLYALATIPFHRKKRLSYWKEMRTTSLWCILVTSVAKSCWQNTTPQ